jgi:hypothetical protein
VTSTPDAPEQAPAPAEQGVPRPPRRQSVRGILATLGVLGGFVAVIFFLVPQPSALRQPTPDVGAIARDAGPVLGFAPAVPAGLDEGWSPTSAEVQDGVDGTPTWRVNYVTPSQSWASVIQGAEATKKWENVQIIDGGERGAVVLDGRTWVVRAREDRGLTAYVLRDPAITTMVAGRASRTELEALIRATPLPPG